MHLGRLLEATFNLLLSVYVCIVIFNFSLFSAEINEWKYQEKQLILVKRKREPTQINER
jgi:hypothetical protein